jgi:glutathione S-transferase
VSAADGKGDEPAVVLYRCPTPTNFLCPCGAVARRLRKLGIEYRTERVPYRRKDRPEVAELTRQNRVPVLIDGEEIVHDSKRILQYLEHTRGGADKPGDAGSTIDPDGNA